MEPLSGLLFSIGVIAMALAFAAHVANTVLLANGRRVLASIAPRQPQPAFAGAVTGSFVERIEERSSMASGGLAGDQTSRIAPAALALTLIALALIGSSMALRAYLVGRGPWGNMFEFTVAFSFTIVAGYTLLQRRYPIQAIGFLPVGVALGLLLYAASLPSDIKPLVPALENRPLLTIHVGMATIAYGIFATSFAAGVGYLIQGRNDRFAWLPSHKVLDEVAYRAVVIGFPIFATMIILGSWWASIAWSRYWGWDPKETAALVTWLTYAVYLHARNQKAWAGRPAALLLVVGFGMVLVTYSGSLWFNGLHAYSGL
ncbi:MAG: c-type cytochrome biogenesis protein CcsB [Chloroflexi bacterium]|nr:MAG: c-type cytochrome biogenesis protein CcsB [Chloroflexota bacterium]